MPSHKAFSLIDIRHPKAIRDILYNIMSGRLIVSSNVKSLVQASLHLLSNMLPGNYLYFIILKRKQAYRVAKNTKNLKHEHLT